jgi:hypothetical protein
MPMTISEITAVGRLRRNDRSLPPSQRVPWTSDFWPRVQRRNRYQGDTGERSGDGQDNDPANAARPFDRSFEHPGVIAERDMLGGVQDQHETSAEQTGRDPRGGDGHPEAGGERGWSVAGGVGLLGRAAPRGDPMPDRRLRDPPSRCRVVGP